MVNAQDVPQQYLFSDHEFRRISPKNRSSLAFILYVHGSKAINNIKTSPLAQALLRVLQQSKTAIELTKGSTFELILDEKFVFRVRKNETANHADVNRGVAVSSETAVI